MVDEMTELSLMQMLQFSPTETMCLPSSVYDATTGLFDFHEPATLNQFK